MMLVMAAPLYAVVITTDLSVLGQATLTWDSSGDGEGVVAMGINVDSPAVIDAVAVDSFFDVFMDAAHDEEAGDGYVYGEGTPIADQTAAGEVALSANFAISMGILGDPTPIAAQTSGMIVLTCAAGAVDVTISENDLRGGIVGESGADLPLTGDLIFTILPDVPPTCITAADGVLYTQWVEAGEPECWCYPTQCYGDADGKSVGSLFAGYTHVNTDDLNILSAGWLIKDVPKGIGILGITGPNGDPAACADFDRNKVGSLFAGYTRVNTNDLDIMSLYYLVKEVPKGTGTPKDCYPGNRAPL